VEERDSQLLQPEPPRKGVCGACVARGWRKHPQIRRAPHNLSTLYQTKHSILRPCCLSCKIYSLFRYESTTPYFLDKCTAAFAVNNHLPQSGKASCRPWSSQNDHPGHISSLFHTHKQYDLPAPMHLHLYLCEFILPKYLHIQTPNATLSSDSVTFLYPRFVSTALSCVLSYLTYLPLPLSIS
jgi:hypothetical protein